MIDWFFLLESKVDSHSWVSFFVHYCIGKNTIDIIWQRKHSRMFSNECYIYGHFFGNIALPSKIKTSTWVACLLSKPKNCILSFMVTNGRICGVGIIMMWHLVADLMFLIPVHMNSFYLWTFFTLNGWASLPKILSTDGCNIFCIGLRIGFRMGFCAPKLHGAAIFFNVQCSIHPYEWRGYYPPQIMKLTSTFSIEFIFWQASIAKSDFDKTAFKSILFNQHHRSSFLVKE